MFPSLSPPDDPSPRGLRPGDGVSKSERGKIVLLGVALLFVAAVLVTATSALRVPGTPPPGADAATPEPPGSGTTMPPIEVAAVPLFPEEEGLEIGKSIRERLGEASILDDVPAPDAGPYETLLRAATLDARVLNLQPEGYEPDPPYARMVEDPAAFRGDPISASGELLSLERVPLGGKDDPFVEVRRGTLRDAAGRLFTWSWPVASAAEEDPVVPGGGWVRVFGLLYKRWPVEDPAKPGARDPSLHLVLPRRPQRAYPPLVVRDVDPAWMGMVRDGTAAEMTNFDEDPLFYLLNLVKNLGPDGWEGWLKAKQESAPGARLWPPEDFTGRFRELLDNPDAHRLRPVKYTAFLAKPVEVPPEWVRPNPGGVDRFWIGYLVDRDFVPAVWAVAPRSLAAAELKSNDLVTVEGFFLKRVAYVPRGTEADRGREARMMQAAVVVAGRITRRELPSRSVGTDVLIVIGGLSVLVAVALGWAILQAGREDARQAQRKREKALRRRAAGAAGTGPAAGPGAAPPPSSPPPPAAGGP